MFHVEMRMGNLSVVHAFNLSEHDLQVQFLAPLMADQDFVYEGLDFTPRKTRLTVLEGAQLPMHELGMGRGWSNAERIGTDVTAEILEKARRGGIQPLRPPTGGALKERILGRLSAGPVVLGDVVRIAGDLMEGHRVSEHLAASEMAVWALLHAGEAKLEVDSAEVPKEAWEALVLSPHAWLDGDAGVHLVAAGSPRPVSAAGGG